MELPQSLTALTPRSMDQVASAAHAVQANVVTLKVAWCRQSGESAEAHDIKTAAPGPVTRLREILLDRRTVRTYTPEEILLRLRQVWGEFCALCWLFPDVDPQHPINLAELPHGQTMRCPTAALAKLEKVQEHLWRIRHEQRRRHDREARQDPGFQKEDEIALAHPIRIYGVAILACGDQPLFSAACEYAGMLAALRWACDRRWRWEGPGIMEVTVQAQSLADQPADSS